MRSTVFVIAAAVLLIGAGKPTRQALVVTAVAVELKPATYESISLVTEGPAYDFSDGDVRGRFQRLLVLEPDVAYDDQVLRFETLGYGDEACCRHLIAAFQVDLGELRKRGISLPEATTAAIDSPKWLGPQQVEVRYGNVICTFKNLGMPKLRVSCRSAA